MSRLHAATLLAVLSLGGCNFNKIAADATAKVAEAGGPGINGFWDYEIVGQAMPGAILQSEALVSVSPDNELLLIGLAKTYVSYAYGWLQDEWELADDAGDFARADKLEQRIQLIYRRAADLSLRALYQHDDGGKLREKLKTGNVEEVRAYVAKEFTDQEDVAPLYWAGLAWGSAIANSGGDVSALAVAPVARSLLERSVELDPLYNDAGGTGVLATVEAMFPELFGGSLEKAKGLYEKALELSKRRNHLITLGYARNYAVNKQDRELFLKLIHEILDAPDLGPDIRLSNKVARHRAERYLQKVDEWFDPALAKVEQPADEALP
jgi:hypothetical protein